MAARTLLALALAPLAMLATAAPAYAQPRIFSATPAEGSRTVRMRPANSISDDRTSATDLTFSVGGLPPGAKIQLGFASSSALTQEQRRQEMNAQVATRCRGRIASAPTAEVSKTVPANGFVTFLVSAMYEIPDDGSNEAATGPCSLNISFVVTERSEMRVPSAPTCSRAAASPNPNS